MATQLSHPNFPHGLHILPLALDVDENGSSFDEQTQKRAIERFGIAGRIWEAAELMIRYFQLSESPNWRLDPTCSIIRREDDRELTIVELGSGTGYVGLKLAKQLVQLEKKNDLVVLTDLPDVCSLLEETLGKERKRWMTSHHSATDTVPVKIFPLPWGDTSGVSQLSSLLNDKANIAGRPRVLTHLVCSDLVYFPHLLAPLLRTLLHLTSSPFARPGKSSPEVIISYKVRSLSKETAFWAAFGLWFSFSPVSACCAVNRTMQDASTATDEEGRLEGDLCMFGLGGFVFVGHRRPESLNWSVPDSDSDLLAGIGARGSDTPKSDDTFESLLMMQMDAY